MQALLVRVVVELLNVLGILGTIQSLMKQLAQEHIAYQIESTVVATSLNVANGTYGLAALHTQIQGVKDDLDASVASLTLQIIHLTDGTTPVSLPPDPPPVYISQPLADIADAVWNNPQPVLITTPGDALLQVAQWADSGHIFDTPLIVGIFRVAQRGFTAGSPYSADVAYPIFDPSGILFADTLLSCLTRQNPLWECSSPWDPQTYVGLSQTGISSVTYTTVIDEAGFQAMKQAMGILPNTANAPVWPGNATVSLGAPVAITTGLTITAPMSGVIVTLTGQPDKSSWFQFDDEKSYRNLGALSFFDDNGEQELPQPLGFTSAVYACKTMWRASGVKLRAVGGVTGTLTPWVND